MKQQLSKTIITFCFFISISSPSQIIYTIAGTGSPAFSGDGGPALSASTSSPSGVVVDGSGNIYISDTYNYRIRKIDATGVISTIAGTGVFGYSGDGGPATSAQISGPTFITMDGSGNIYFPDNNRIRKIDGSGIISTIAGIGTAGFGGDGGPATSAQVDGPKGIAVDASGNVFFADCNNERIRKIDGSGTISTIAGTGSSGFAGDGGPAVNAKFKDPYGICIDASGNMYIADANNDRIRKIDPSGTITTIAGTGVLGYGGDGGQATLAKIDPWAVCIDASGNLYIADHINYRVRKIDPSGIITTVAGNGTFGYSGDGGLATLANINLAIGVAVDGSGNIYIPDKGNNRVREVCVTSCVMGLKPEEAITNTYQIYPNPNNGSFKIKTEKEESMLIIFNLVGAKVHEQKIVRGENIEMNTQLARGLYTYSFMENGHTTGRGKLVVE